MNQSVVLFIFACLYYLPVGYAAQPKMGDSVNGGIFLYRESVEGYWNDWVAYPLLAKSKTPTRGQADVTILGEGKTAAFIGNLSINCESGKYYWKSAGSDSEFLTHEEQANNIVPKQVIQKAVKIFCKK